jgi:regulator of protease activity HflC (stomatin/prohibitin superfamily)
MNFLDFAFGLIPSTMVIDERVVTTSLAAEQNLTADKLPMTVDAVLFWKVIDPENAALSVQDYKQAIRWAAHTKLRAILPGP